MRKTGRLLYELAVHMVNGSGLVAVGFIFALCGLMMTNVLLRAVRIPFAEAVELSGFLMVLITAFGLAYTLRQGGHVRVDMVITRLRPGQRRILETITSSIGLLLVIALIWFTTDMTISSYTWHTESFEIEGFYVWIIQICMPIGLSVLLLAVAIHIGSIWSKNKGTK